MRAARLLVWLLASGVALAGCASGIGRERAIEVARAESGDADAAVLRAERGPLLRFALGPTTVEGPADREAWAITLGGSFAGECVLDAATGAFIVAVSPAP
jgi:hypothetical protein